MTGRSSDYSRIRTLEQLRAERLRLSMLIELQETRLRDDGRHLRGMFSLSYLTGIVSRHVDSWQELVCRVYGFVRCVTTLFRRPVAAEPEGDAAGCTTATRASGKASVG